MYRPGRNKWEGAPCAKLAHTCVQAILKRTWTQTNIGKLCKVAKLTDFFVRPGKIEDAVNAAEGAFAFHTVKHHNSYRSMDCTSALLKKAFPDSDTAKKFMSSFLEIKIWSP